MSPTTWKSWLVTVVAAVAVAIPLTVSAQSLNQVLDAQQRKTRLAQQSQERIDAVVKQTNRLEDQYKAVMKEIDGLKVYNRLLSLQVENQRANMEDLRASIDQVEVINRQIVPIMTQMIDSLEQFVALDIPFLLDERTDRVVNLKELMERDDVTVAEKFRKVTEAYQIEMDYGRTIEYYADTLTIDGNTRELQFLRIGRIGLIYQSADGNINGAWDKQAGQWVALGNEYKNSIKRGLQIAKKQIAPDLVLLPINGPEAG